MTVDYRETLAGLIVAAVVAVHDAPEGIFVDLELEPIMTASGVSEVPGIDRVGTFDQFGLGVPSPGVTEDVM